VIDEEIPFPPNSGKRIRTFNLFKYLAKKHEIVWISRQLEGVQSSRTDFEALGIRTQVLGEPVRRKSGLQFYISLLANLLSPNPYVVSSHFSKEMSRAIRDICLREPFDLVHCEWTPYAANMQGLGPLPTVCSAHNVESMVWYRNQCIEKNPIKKLYIGLQARKMERFERQTLPAFTRVISVSDRDRHIISTWVASDHIAVIPNGVDIDYFRRDCNPEVPKSLVFVGSLDWRPNIDCVLYFLDEIWPLVKSAVPESSFSIVGRNPHHSLRIRAEREPSVNIYASVQDVRPFVNSATVCVVPLRIGSGSRLKILEAFAMEKAVVSTSIGAEGLEVEHGRHLLIADSPADFAGAVAKLLSDAERRRQLSVEGRELVERQYAWPALAAQLESEWEKASCQHP